MWQTGAQLGAWLCRWDGDIHCFWDPAWLLQHRNIRSAVSLGILKAVCSHPGEMPTGLAVTPQVPGRGFLYQLGAGPDDVDFLCHAQHACIQKISPEVHTVPQSRLSYSTK